MKHLQRFGLGLAVLLIALMALTARVVLAQDAPTLAPAPVAAPVAVITATSMTIATFAFLVAFLVNAYNTGKVFGAIVVPQTWLPYVGVGLPFVTAVYASLANVILLTPVTIFNAIQSGLFALLASAGGASAHIAMAQHFQAPHVVRMARLRSSVEQGVMAASIPPAVGVSSSIPPASHIHSKNILPILCFAGVLSAASFLPACTPAERGAAATAVGDIAVCVLTHYSDPPEKIVIECDGVKTIEDVNKILDASTAMARRKAANMQSVQP